MTYTNASHESGSPVSPCWAARDLLRKNNFHTSISQGDLLVDVNKHSARLAFSICTGRGLEYIGVDILSNGQSVARFRLPNRRSRCRALFLHRIFRKENDL